MEVREIRVDTQPPDSDRVRLTARVAYMGGGWEDDSYDVPESCASELSTGGNRWLALLLPLFSRIDQAVRIGSPIDAYLRANASRVGAMWRSWYANLSTREIDAGLEGPEQILEKERTASLFSGGADSLFTLLR